MLEADLWRLWEGQRFPKTGAGDGGGEALRVIFRGGRGRAGADFRGAMIASPGGLLSGT